LYKDFTEKINDFSIDAEKFRILCKNEILQPSDQQLLTCIIGKALNYKYYQAAITLQSFIKMRLYRKKYLETRKLIYHANYIKQKWRSYKMKQYTDIKVAQKWKTIYSNWQNIQANFKNNWDEIKTQKRVEIHVPSLS